MGRFGRTVEHAEVLSWESDDLATLEIARHISEATTSAVARRLLRAAIAWTAEFAMSVPLRHAALTLLTDLDELDDEPYELLMHGHSKGLPTRRHVAVPTLDQLRATDAAREEQNRELSDEQRATARSADIEARVDNQLRARELLAKRVVRQLVAVGPPSRIVAVLDTACREIRAALPTAHLSLWDLWRQLNLAPIDLVPEIVRAIADNRAGPLDQNLDQLLDAWAQRTRLG